jgi:hypothetical protein
MPRKPKSSTLPTEFQPGFLSKLDGRTEISRLLNGNYQAIVADLGGEAEQSHIKLALVERFTFLEAVLCGIESQIALARTVKGKAGQAAAVKLESELIGKWIQAVNSLTGLAKTLGIERRANDPLSRYYDQSLTVPTSAASNGDTANGHDRANTDTEEESDG